MLRHCVFIVKQASNYYWVVAARQADFARRERGQLRFQLLERHSTFRSLLDLPLDLERMPAAVRSASRLPVL